LEIAHLDLARDLRSDSANRSEIETQVDAISKLQGNLMKTAVMARLDVRGVLTADQRHQLTEARFHGGPMRGAERPSPGGSKP
jgi:Spy/CpxP family protein refolding chaperone